MIEFEIQLHEGEEVVVEIGFEQIPNMHPETRQPVWRNASGKPGPWCICGNSLTLVNFGEVPNSNITYGEWHCLTWATTAEWRIGCGRQWFEDDQSATWSESA